MRDRLTLFSTFVRDLTAASNELDAPEVLTWATRALSDILGFDSAWYGWAQIREDGPVIHASATYNLPDGYFRAWREISEQDLLVAQFQKDPAQVPTYDRRGPAQTEGMRHLADTYGLSRMATAMNLRAGRAASLWISAYRGGERARAWSEVECEFLQCAVDHIAAAARSAADRTDRGRDGAATSLIINRRGVAIVGLAAVQERFGHIWTRSDSDSVPRCLAEFIDQPGEHILIDRELVATCEGLPGPSGMGLQRMSLRPLQKFDLLTERERAVARSLAAGMSHKEAARALGVAPSTIRNQTQSIYGKLGVDNRASLAAEVP